MCWLPALLVLSAKCCAMRWRRSGYVVRAAVRRDVEMPIGASEKVVIGDIGAGTAWREALSGVGSVVHLAARAHMLHAHQSELSLYAEINAHATRSLASASAQAGVRRFVFLSSVKVNGEGTVDRAFTASDKPHPQDSYGESKWLGERFLIEVASDTGMEAVVVRSPLVYGPGVRANFLRLMRWVDSGWPIPFGAVNNARSLVSVWNLCDFIALALRSPTSAKSYMDGLGRCGHLNAGARAAHRWRDEPARENASHSGQCIAGLRSAARPTSRDRPAVRFSRGRYHAGAPRAGMVAAFDGE